MSSSPSTPQSSTCVVSPLRISPYRQVDYFDGKSVLIAESRRRSHVIPSGGSSRSDRYFQIAPEASQVVPSTSFSSTQPLQPRPTLPDGRPTATKHVTLTSRSKAKAIIVQSPSPVKPQGVYAIPQVQVTGISTPPPTPKIDRLPTPELEDLDERPFCDCCIKLHVVKYCTSCGNELGYRKG